MATEKETAFPIESFLGVNQNLDKEDISVRHFNTLQNVWERKVGVMETRYGSEKVIKESDLPSRVIGLDNLEKLQKKDGEKCRVQAIHCSPSLIDQKDSLVEVDRDGTVVADVGGGSFAAGTYDCAIVRENVSGGGYDVEYFSITLALNDAIDVTAPSLAGSFYTFYCEDSPGSNTMYITTASGLAPSGTSNVTAPPATSASQLPTILGGEALFVNAPVWATTTTGLTFAVVGGSYGPVSLEAAVIWKSGGEDKQRRDGGVTGIPSGFGMRVTTPTDAAFTYDVYYRQVPDAGGTYPWKLHTADAANSSNVDITSDTGSPQDPPKVGYWLRDNNFWGTSMKSEHVELMVRFYGYGTDHCYRMTTSDMEGYSYPLAATDGLKLRINLPGDLAGNFVDSNVQGFEVYAKCNLDSGAIGLHENWIWVGARDFKTEPLVFGANYFDFYYSPIAQINSTAALAIGETRIAYVVSTQLTDNGTLVPGKTYYVGVGNQYLKAGLSGAAGVVGLETGYRQPNCRVTSGSYLQGFEDHTSDVVPITIPNGANSIRIDKVQSDEPDAGPGSIRCSCAFIGESPQLLRPIGIRNNSILTLPAPAPPIPDTPNPIEDMAWDIDVIPVTQPGVADYFWDDGKRVFYDVTFAGTGTITIPNHGFSDTDLVIYDSDAEAIPGLVKGNTYQILSATTNTFEVSVPGPTPSAILFEDDNLAFVPGAHYLTPETVTTLGNVLHFKWSDFSIKDMLIKINDDDTFDPIFCSRMSYYLNNTLFLEGDGAYPAEDLDYISETSDVVFNEKALTPYLDYARMGTDGLQGFGDQSKYNFTPFRDLLFIVNDYDPRTVVDAATKALIRPKNSSNLFVCDGGICARVNPGYQASYTKPITPPPAKFISKFQNQLVLAGGNKALDIFTGITEDLRRSITFSNAIDDFLFASSKIGSPLNFVQVESPDPITGIGGFTNTTGDETLSQLIISKKNELWALTDLPIPDPVSGQLPRTLMVNLSKKAGGFHKTFAHTPIGTIVADPHGVYLLRLQGEPTPIGEEISPILEKGDLTNAVAVYHDQYYKLSFYHPDYGSPDDPRNNNVEFWLDIRKMKAMEGQPDWKGPMVGRNIQYNIVEDEEEQEKGYLEFRDRYCVDNTTGFVFKTDIIPLQNQDKIFDFGIPVKQIIETKDLEISKQDNNWNKLIVRSYLKLKTNRYSAPLVITEDTYIDGELYESKDITFTGNKDVEFDSQPLKLSSIFPTGRPRGRTIRKVYSTEHRMGIGGFQVNYRVERRRI